MQRSAVSTCHSCSTERSFHYELLVVSHDSRNESNPSEPVAIAWQRNESLGSWLRACLADGPNKVRRRQLVPSQPRVVPAAYQVKIVVPLGRR